MRVEPAVGTQNRIVLDLLRQRPLCSNDIYRTPGVTHRLAARINDLRYKFGWDASIKAEPCKDHAHTSNATKYSFINQDQLELNLNG